MEHFAISERIQGILLGFFIYSAISGLIYYFWLRPKHGAAKAAFVAELAASYALEAFFKEKTATVNLYPPVAFLTTHALGLLVHDLKRPDEKADILNRLHAGEPYITGNYSYTLHKVAMRHGEQVWHLTYRLEDAASEPYGMILFVDWPASEVTLT